MMIIYQNQSQCQKFLRDIFPRCQNEKRREERRASSGDRRTGVRWPQFIVIYKILITCNALNHKWRHLIVRQGQIRPQFPQDKSTTHLLKTGQTTKMKQIPKQKSKSEVTNSCDKNGFTSENATQFHKRSASRNDRRTLKVQMAK